MRDSLPSHLSFFYQFGMFHVSTALALLLYSVEQATRQLIRLSQYSLHMTTRKTGTG